MIGNTRASRFAVGFIVLWSLLISLPARAQVSASPPAKTPSLEDAVQALAGQVKELSTTIQALRSEVSRSREETRELRSELQGAMEKLSSASRGPATVEKGAPAVAVAPAVRQEPAAPAPSEARLNRLEEDQQLLQAKVDEQHQTKVESASKYRVKFGGIALLNLFGNSGTVDNQDVPNMALPPGPLSTSGSVGATVRQSELGLEVFGPTLAGARTSGEVNFDFMGGFADVSNGVTEDLVRLRTATMRLDWDRTSVVGGQDALFFSPLSPTSFASLGYPAFADAGNLWTWTPQLRIEHRSNISESDRLLLQGGVLDPLSGEPPYSQDYRVPSGGEQSRKPAVASRVAWIHGSGDRAMTMGVGGYYSRQNYGAGRTVDAWAGTADWNAPLGNHFALSGEFYGGRALGGLGAAQGRSVLFGGVPTDPTSEVLGLETMGGWTQLKFKATGTIEFNAAFGEDNPFARDLRYFSAPSSAGYASVAKNQNALFNVIFRPRSDLLFALEYRYLNTEQTTNSINTAGTLNLSMGVLF
jgi:outer membrane murein-binding lipoprotein Lpp